MKVSTFEHPNRAILVEQFSWAQAAAGIRSGLFHALQMRKARIADECACLESRRTARSPGFESPAFRHSRYNRARGPRMTLLDLGRIASHLDTALAHAMLHAVAVAKDRGSEWGWATA